MKMLACDCLNIIIETEANDFQKVNQESLNLTKEETEDSFFKQEIKQVEKLNNISKIHSGLVEIRHVGSWAVHHCINCKVHTHAIHREKGASCVLVNSKLMSSEEIEKLRSSENFSKIFGIVVHTGDITDDEEIQAESYLEPTVKVFKETLSDVLKKEALEVERRVKQYTEEQYASLENFREKAFNEQQALIRIIKNHINANSQPESTNTSMLSTSLGRGLPTRLNEPLEAGTKTALNISTNTRHTPKRQKSSPSAQVNSIDAEGLFEFDGIDDVNSLPPSDMEESDTEADISISKQNEEGTAIPRTRGGSLSVAKSLPMNIPVFLTQSKNQVNEDIDDLLPPEDNIDIAASIKKLAKSVHGNAVFGDLPKPRFSTQI